MTTSVEGAAGADLWREENEWPNETAEGLWKAMGELVANPDFYAVVERTPLIPVPAEALPADLRDSGYTVLVKHEGMQPTGAYKLRGATSALLGHKGPVVAASTGNHATAVGYAAYRLGTGPVDVMCPSGVSQAKLAAMRRFGVVAHPDFETLADAMEAAEAAGLDPGTLFVHPYDDELVVAGQGTIGMEIADDVEDLVLATGARITVHVPGAGGGIASGTAVGLKKRLSRTEQLPGVEVCVNQTQGAAGIVAALEGRVIEDIDPAVDGAAVKRPGELAMQVIGDSRYVDGVNSHGNGGVGEAMAVLGRVHEVPEPAGALSMAGALQYMRANPRDPGDATPHVIVAVTSGAVVTPEKVREFMAAAYHEGWLTGPEAQATYSKAYGERSVWGVDEVLQRPLGATAMSGLWILSGPTARA